MTKTANAPMIAEPRLPYHPAVEERFGVGLTEWRALVDAVYPLAKETSSVIMALAYCRARKLDPFKKPVHIVPMWNGQLKRMVETVWPGIGELRTTAFRTGQFAGRDEAKYGETKRQKVGTATIEFPEWCQITVYRMLNGHRVGFPGPRVYWLESYASSGRDDPTPNSMWMRRPFGQIEKCAEAAALRSAFPEEVGNEYTAEEMEGRIIEGIAEPSAPLPPPPPPSDQQRLQAQPAKPEPQKVETIEPKLDTPPPPPIDGDIIPPKKAEPAAPPPPAAELDTAPIGDDEAEELLGMLQKALATAVDAGAVHEAYDFLDIEASLTGVPGAVERARAMKQKRLDQLSDLAAAKKPAAGEMTPDQFEAEMRRLIESAYTPAELNPAKTLWDSSPAFKEAIGPDRTEAMRTLYLDRHRQISSGAISEKDRPL